MAAPRTDGLTVCERKCDECLFTPGRIVRPGRVREIVKACHAEGTYFVCHKGSLTGNNKLVCRGFYDTQKTQVIRIAERLGVVHFVPVPGTD